MGKTKTCSSHMPLPRARLAPRAGGLMMEDLHSWLHRRRRYHFCFCSPLAHSAAIGGAMEYCRGTDAASVGAEHQENLVDESPSKWSLWRSSRRWAAGQLASVRRRFAAAEAAEQSSRRWAAEVGGAAVAGRADGRRLGGGIA
ncbi:uncharacterized protein [Triticum aestivum]|uniref:uncharacterized protein isoform X1 n=1 Tax=Triticum aestivum TaxID=4565 RepID=UPI001D013A73|nr:uncharacterized protein LOC123053403 isoform X1 [Triticum aestivum]